MPSKPEEWDTFYAKAGRPETPDKYQYVAPDLGVDGHQFDLPEGFEEGLRRTAHAAKMNQVQFDAYVKAETEALRSEITEARERGKQAEESLRSMWGAAADVNLALSQRALDFYDPKGELKDLLVESGLGNHPAIIKMFYDASTRLVGDGLIPGEVAGAATPDVALTKINELTKNPAYLDGAHPDHFRVLEEVQRLYELAYNVRR